MPLTTTTTAVNSDFAAQKTYSTERSAEKIDNQGVPKVAINSTKSFIDRNFILAANYVQT